MHVCTCGTLMASKLVHHFRLIIFLILFLLFIGVKSSSSSSFSSSWTSERSEADYKRWVSWNVQNYRKKTTLKAELKSPAGYNQNEAVDSVDEKLKKAEMNKMRIAVSQDGSGDFTTISQALNAIPLRNTRRVIINIKPGVYR